MDINEVKKIFRDNGITITKDDAWTVQGSTMVVKHKALERLAAAFKIVWDAPVVVRAERDEAVIMCRATRPDNGVVEWSFGEALVNVNYRVTGKQAGYVYAMAEKRAKDRVILKLCGLHGVYSEEENEEDFARGKRTDDGRDETVSEPPPAPTERRQAPVEKPAQQPVANDTGKPASDNPVVIALKTRIEEAATINAVTDLMLSEDVKAQLADIGAALADEVREAGKARLAALGWRGTRRKAPEAQAA